MAYVLSSSSESEPTESESCIPLPKKRRVGRPGGLAAMAPKGKQPVAAALSSSDEASQAGAEDDSDVSSQAIFSC